MKTFLASDRFYWSALLVALFTFLAIDYLLIIPLSRDLGVNFLSEAIFMMVTIVFLDRLVVARERSRMKPLAEQALIELGRRLYSMFNVLKGWVVIEPFPPVWSPEEFGHVLEDLSKTQKLELSNHFGDYIPDAKSWDLDLELEEFLESRLYIQLFEMRYLEFMKPELRMSLLEIERSMHSIEVAARFLREEKGSPTIEEFFQSLIARDILTVLKQIGEIRGMGIDVFHPLRP